jgi:3-phosphoglycerate kinase
VSKKTIRDIDVSGKRVLVRVDFNVPLDPKTKAIADDIRIRESLPTIRYLLDKKARVILCSHLGRPKGRDKDASLAPVARRLSQLLGLDVAMADDCIGPAVEKQAAALKEGQVLMLENLRFHAEEEKNDPAFAQALARIADVFVNDAFGTAHRAHASTEGVTHSLPAVAGFLIQKELEVMGKALQNPDRPFTAITGGAKISDKIDVLQNILEKVDCLLVAGGMAATFLKALKYNVGQSLVENDKVGAAQQLMDKAKARGVRLLLPQDAVVAAKFEAQAEHRVVPVDKVPPGWYLVDIGPVTIESFGAELRRSRTVIWNGPLGVFEYPAFRKGTEAIASVMGSLSAVTIIGGGSTAEAVQELGLADKMTHVSTGGGASLTFLEGKPMPAIVALLDKQE